MHGISFDFTHGPSPRHLSDSRPQDANQKLMKSGFQFGGNNDTSSGAHVQKNEAQVSSISSKSLDTHIALWTLDSVHLKCHIEGRRPFLGIVHEDIPG